jgi:hypothetical protein
VSILTPQSKHCVYLYTPPCQCLLAELAHSTRAAVAAATMGNCTARSALHAHCTLCNARSLHAHCTARSLHCTLCNARSLHTLCTARSLHALLCTPSALHHHCRLTARSLHSLCTARSLHCTLTARSLHAHCTLSALHALCTARSLHALHCTPATSNQQHPRSLRSLLSPVVFPLPCGLSSLLWSFLSLRWSHGSQLSHGLITAIL